LKSRRSESNIIGVVAIVVAFVSASILPVPLPSLAQEKSPKPKLPTDVLQGVLYCAEGREGRKTIRQFSGEDFAVVRYLIRSESTNAEPSGEIYLLSYSKNEAKAWLYEFNVEQRENSFILSWINTAKLRRLKNGWRVEDTLGGVSTYETIAKVANDAALSERIKLSYPNSVPKNIQCIDSRHSK